MRALANVKKRHDTEMRKRKERANRPIPERVLERRRLKQRWAGCKFKTIGFRNLHPDFHARLRQKCAAEDYTVAGKMRDFMLGCIEGTINQYAVESALYGVDIKKAFGPMPKGAQNFITVQFIPEQLHRDFKIWCAVRGLTISGKLRQLMFAYLKGIIK